MHCEAERNVCLSLVSSQAVFKQFWLSDGAVV